MEEWTGMSIILKNINKSFGAFKALNTINLEFKSGELTALLGPSGSGKTTLLRIVAGLEEADRGNEADILFDQESVTGSPVHRRNVGFVFQHYALFRHMTVFENIAFGLRVKPRSERPDNKTITGKVMRLLSLVQMESLAERYPPQLSGGQRQRIALARALAIEPKVLLLDEPFGALDAQVRSELRRWLRQLHDTIHVTSIFVTHDQEEALEVADRIVVMNRGVIEQVGTPEDVFHRPANKFVMQFLGDVNVFHGRIESGHAVFTEAPDESVEAAARMLVRPHDLLIQRPHDGAGQGIPAKVYRVLTAGSVVKVELIDHQNRLIQVHLSHERYRETPVTPHEEVIVVPHKPHVYAGEDKWDGNYVI
jgi:sulfate transport system ATP-binding protein